MVVLTWMSIPDVCGLDFNHVVGCFTPSLTIKIQKQLSLEIILQQLFWQVKKKNFSFRKNQIAVKFFNGDQHEE